jgi:hypothetical protein
VISDVAPTVEAAAANDETAKHFFCAAAGRMLAAGHGFPDASKYAWITDPRHYRNSFEASCQGDIVNLLICLWEHRAYRCEKTVIVRNEHTGGYHMETYETTHAFFACISYQFSNLINRFSLLNHYAISVGQNSPPLPCVTPTDEVGGQAIERAIRTQWAELCPHLDSFLLTLEKASAYQSSEVLLNEHVAEGARQFYTSENYAHLRDAARLLAGPFYVPPEAMWTMYSDQVLHFTLAHELMHIHNGDMLKRGRDTAEEIGADMGAVDLLAYVTTATAKRSGYQPSIANIIIGPIVFFTLSRVFAYFDDFERKYRAKTLDEAAMTVAMKEELNLLQRSISVAAFLVAGGWVTDPGAAPFWNITGELRLLEIALRRRLWELGRVRLSLPAETEIAMVQDSIGAAKRRTERDVGQFRNRQGNANR